MRNERYEMLQYLVVESAVIVWHIGPDSVFGAQCLPAAYGGYPQGRRC